MPSYSLSSPLLTSTPPPKTNNPKTYPPHAPPHPPPYKLPHIPPIPILLRLHARIRAFSLHWYHYPVLPLALLLACWFLPSVGRAVESLNRALVCVAAGGYAWRWVYPPAVGEIRGEEEVEAVLERLVRRGFEGVVGALREVREQQKVNQNEIRQVRSSLRGKGGVQGGAERLGGCLPQQFTPAPVVVPAPVVQSDTKTQDAIRLIGQKLDRMDKTIELNFSSLSTFTGKLRGLSSSLDGIARAYDPQFTALTEAVCGLQGRVVEVCAAGTDGVNNRISYLSTGIKALEEKLNAMNERASDGSIAVKAVLEKDGQARRRQVEALQKAAEEIYRVVAYLGNEIVPEVGRLREAVEKAKNSSPTLPLPPPPPPPPPPGAFGQPQPGFNPGINQGPPAPHPPMQTGSQWQSSNMRDLASLQFPGPSPMPPRHTPSLFDTPAPSMVNAGAPSIFSAPHAHPIPQGSPSKPPPPNFTFRREPRPGIGLGIFTSPGREGQGGAEVPQELLGAAGGGKGAGPVGVKAKVPGGGEMTVVSTFKAGEWE